MLCLLVTLSSRMPIRPERAQVILSTVVSELTGGQLKAGNLILPSEEKLQLNKQANWPPANVTARQINWQDAPSVKAVLSLGGTILEQKSKRLLAEDSELVSGLVFMIPVARVFSPEEGKLDSNALDALKRLAGEVAAKRQELMVVIYPDSSVDPKESFAKSVLWASELDFALNVDSAKRKYLRIEGAPAHFSGGKEIEGTDKNLKVELRIQGCCTLEDQLAKVSGHD